MTFTSHFFVLVAHWRLLVAGACVLLFFSLVVTVPRYPQRKAVPAVSSVEPSALPVINFRALRQHSDVFRPLVIAAAGRDAVLWSDYRFAGTFFVYDGASLGSASLRRAVVSYRPERQQYIVSEGDMIGGVEVVRIDAQELVLRSGEQEGVLLLGGRQGATARGETGPSRAASGEYVGTAQTRFGQQTGAGAWHMERNALLEYYEELLDEPERLLQVFDSMRPLYAPDGSIEGYQLQPVGESAFFTAVGFKEGDTVRAVNKLPMTNRRRAEFFIQQVVENDLSAIVIDIERDGAEERLIYELR